MERQPKRKFVTRDVGHIHSGQFYERKGRWRDVVKIDVLILFSDKYDV